MTVDHGVLTISGERREEGADENRVSARFRNGVLEISIPVSDREQGRRVKVQS